MAIEEVMVTDLCALGLNDFLESHNEVVNVCHNTVLRHLHPDAALMVKSATRQSCASHAVASLL